VTQKLSVHRTVQLLQINAILSGKVRRMGGNMEKQDWTYFEIGSAGWGDRDWVDGAPCWPVGITAVLGVEGSNSKSAERSAQMS